MRITGGILRNRRFEVPDGAVRPTMEAVREAVFSALGGSCAGLKVLDLFAGSGSLGLEAWSRGAATVTFVEKDFRIHKALQQTVDALKGPELGPARCIRADAIPWLGRAGERFDLVLADPPYDLHGAMRETLDGIAARSVLTPGGTIVYELRSSDAEVPHPWRVSRDKTYGKTRVLMLKRERGSAT